MSYVEFVDAMTKNSVNNSNIENFKEDCIIEIMGEQDLLVHPFYFKNDNHNVLRLLFDDVDTELTAPLLGDIRDDREYIPVVPMSEVQAHLILRFIEFNKEAKRFFIHCAAGISRSAAVAKFVAEYFNVPNKAFDEMNPSIQPNIRILLMLRRLINRR